MDKSAPKKRQKQANINGQTSELIYAKKFHLSIIALTFVIILTSVLTVFLSWYQQNGLIEKSTKEQLNYIAKSMANQNQQYIDSTKFLLSVLAKDPNVSNKNPNVCKSFLKNQINLFEQYASFNVLNLNGDVICSSADNSNKINLADQDFFKQTINNKSFAVGGFQIGKITRLPVLSFSYPIFDEKGQLSGVINAGLNLNWLNKNIKALQLPAGTELLLLDKKGQILASAPNGQAIGNSALGVKFIKDNIGKSGEFSGQSNGLDNTSRHYTMQSFGPNNDTYLVLGIPSSYLQELTRNNAILRLIIVTGLGLVSLAGVWLIGKRLLVKPLTLKSQSLSVIQREQEGRYKLLINDAPDPIMALNKKGVVIEVNKKAAELTGKPTKEIIGKSFTKFSSLVSPKDIPLIGNHFSEMVMGKEIDPYDLELKTVKGKKIFQVNITEVKMGKEPIFQIIMRDVTERSENQAELEARTQELEKLNKIMVDRELVMVRLKKENKTLKKRLKQ